MPPQQNPYYYLLCFVTTSAVLLGLFSLLNLNAEFQHQFSGRRTGPGRHAGPHSSLITIEPILTDDPTTPGASVATVPYGPYTALARSMRPEEIFYKVSKPCTNCYVLAMHAMLQDANGTELFTDSGMLLHHIIFFNRARPDLVCPGMAGERFYGGGNERWTRRWNSGGPWGYHIGDDDQWDIVVELMNDADVDMAVHIVVRFEYILAKDARDYRGIAVAWLDLTGCGNAEVDVKSITDAFEYRTPNWTSPVGGIIVDMGGHMHDGGVSMTGYRNGHPICTSKQLYDNQVRLTDQHIVAAGMCKDAGEIRKGDVLWADAKYDPAIHPLWMHDNKPDRIMGSMGVYIGLD